MVSFIKGIFNFLRACFMPKQARIENEERMERNAWTKRRHEVWEKYHGDAEQGICYTCGNQVQRRNKGWHCSHVQALARGGSNEVENLRVCCAHCNLSMHTTNLYLYTYQKKLTGPASKKAKQYCIDHKLI